MRMLLDGSERTARRGTVLRFSWVCETEVVTRGGKERGGGGRGWEGGGGSQDELEILRVEL